MTKARHKFLQETKLQVLCLVLVAIAVTACIQGNPKTPTDCEKQSVLDYGKCSAKIELCDTIDCVHTTLADCEKLINEKCK